MRIRLTRSQYTASVISFVLPPSKSLAARQYIIDTVQGLNPASLNIQDHLPEDLAYLHQALRDAINGSETIHVGESGTAMRFMLAYLAATVKSPTLLCGSGRQYQRPIAPLVDALRALGGHIIYTDQEGYPPLSIKPSELKASTIDIDASASSQYLSALLLIAPLIKGEPYTIRLCNGQLASAPYAQMTISAMREAGYYWQQIGDVYRYINSSPGRMRCAATAEADWTAASYAYLLQSLQRGTYAGHITIKGLRMTSQQGDSQILPQVFENLGVETQIERNYIQLSSSPSPHHQGGILKLGCNDCPDLVPTLVAACIAKGVAFELSGIKHLRLKESDRVEALRTECSKIGVRLSVIDDRLIWDGSMQFVEHNATPLILCTHGDHRIAMALAPLFASICSEVIVDESSVVHKSFPAYWGELSKFGYITEPI